MSTKIVATTKATTTRRFVAEAHSEAELDYKITKFLEKGYRLLLRLPKTALRIRVANGLALEPGRCGALLEAPQ